MVPQAGSGGTVTTDLFEVVTPAPVPETDPTIGAKTVAAFWEQCGEICAVPLHSAQNVETFTSPLVPVPVESDGETVTVTGGEGEVAIAVSPEAAIESWNSVTPRGWLEQDGYEGGELTTDPTGSLLTVACAAGESCSVPLDEVTAPENGVTSYYMAEVEGTVQVSHVYATGG